MIKIKREPVTYDNISSDLIEDLDVPDIKVEECTDESEDYHQHISYDDASNDIIEEELEDEDDVEPYLPQVDENRILDDHNVDKDIVKHETMSLDDCEKSSTLSDKNILDTTKVLDNESDFIIEECISDTEESEDEGSISTKEGENLNIEDDSTTCDDKLAIKENENIQFFTVNDLKFYIDEITLKCKICNKYFTQKSSLVRHIKIHSGIKEFKCKICDKLFGRKVNLTEHLKIHSGVKEYVCEVCAKLFVLKSHLKRHLKIHAGIREFKCDICNKFFQQKPHLNAHLKTHSGVKNFKCEICNKFFTLKAHLKRHFKVHSK